MSTKPKSAGFCGCGRTAVKRIGNQGVCAKCLQIEAGLGHRAILARNRAKREKAWAESTAHVYDDPEPVLRHLHD